MKKHLLSAFAGALILTSLARADLYNFTFTEDWGGPTTATGQVDVVGGFATSGYIDVSGPGAGHFDFIVAGGTLHAGLSSFGAAWYDSPLNYFYTDGAVAVAGNPFVSDGGLLFGAGGTELNLLYSNNTYYLLGRTGATYSPVASGTATLTAAVPEEGATVAMLGAAVLVFAALRRRTG